MKYIVKFSGSILVEAREGADGEDDALYALGQLTGDELLNAIDSSTVRKPTPSELREFPLYKTEDYL
jgi:hypothetical protein